MAQTGKKQNFLQGVMLLTIATAVVKVIGAFYKIPLQMVVGVKGYGYFTTAYDIYSVLLLISTAGLPVAMSRMISQASALGNYNQVRRVYSVARNIFLGLGLVSTALMMLFAKQLAAFQQQPDAWASIAMLGPCALFMGLISTYRGFSQGQGNMKPTSVSQVIEAVIKLGVGLAAAYFVMEYTNDMGLAAAAAIFGVTVSCLISVVYLNRTFAAEKAVLPQSEDVPMGRGAVAKGLLGIAVPITIGAAGLQLLTVLEQSLYMGQLLGGLGLSQSVADEMKGVYSMTTTIFNMPCAFIIPITISIIPAITSHLTLDDHKGVKETEESAARITGLISLPCSVGLAVLARPVMALLGDDYSGELLDLAEQLMRCMSICIFLYGIVQYTNAVMQAHGKAHVPVVNMLLSGGVRLVVVYLLSGNPAIGIVGVSLGAILCYLCIAVLNLIGVRKYVPQRPALVKNLLRPLLPAAIMGVSVFGCYWGLTQWLGADGSKIILCGAPILVGVVVYCVCVVLFKSITADDCKLLPKGEKIAKFLHL